MKKITKQKKYIIDIKNVNFRYPGGGRDKLHLDDVTVRIPKGEWTTILGPNGSGKSTLAKAIIRINKPKSGTVKLNGKNVRDYKGKEFAKNVAYIPQQIEIPHGTSVYDFISFGRNPYLGVTGTLSKNDKAIIQKAMEQTTTWQWKDKMMDELSGGQRQKVLIAMIVVQDADVILLDEPTTYLDIRNQYELLEMMHNEHLKGKTIIAILHDINQAVQYSDNLFIMKDAKIYTSGDPSVVITPQTLAEVYGVDASLYEDGGRKYITDVKLIDFELSKHRGHLAREKVHTVSTQHPNPKKTKKANK